MPTDTTTHLEFLKYLAFSEDEAIQPIAKEHQKKLDQYNKIIGGETLSYLALAAKTGIPILGGLIELTIKGAASTYTIMASIVTGELTATETEKFSVSKKEQATDEKKILVKDIKKKYENMAMELLHQYVAPDRYQTENKDTAFKIAEALDGKKIERIIAAFLERKVYALYYDKNIKLLKIAEKFWKKIGASSAWLGAKVAARITAIKEEITEVEAKIHEHAKRIVVPLKDAAELVAHLAVRQKPLYADDAHWQQNSMFQHYVNISDAPISSASSHHPPRMRSTRDLARVFTTVKNEQLGQLYDESDDEVEVVVHKSCASPSEAYLPQHPVEQTLEEGKATTPGEVETPTSKHFPQKGRFWQEKAPPLQPQVEKLEVNESKDINMPVSQSIGNALAKRASNH